MGNEKKLILAYTHITIQNVRFEQFMSNQLGNDRQL